MRFFRVIAAGAAGAALFVAGASTPVQETENERYYRKLFVQDQWPVNFRPDLAVRMKCNPKVQTIGLEVIDLTVSPHRKLVGLPPELPQMINYPQACHTYFMVSSSPQHPEQAFAAVTLDYAGRLYMGAGGVASSEMAKGSAWMAFKQGGVALIQTQKNSAQVPELRPDENGNVRLPDFP